MYLQRFRDWYNYYGKEIELCEADSKTHPISVSKATLKRMWPSIKIANKQTMQGSTNDFSIALDPTKINDLDHFVKILSNLGWFIAVVDFFKDRKIIFKLDKNISVEQINSHKANCDILVLYVEAKFDLEINTEDFPKILFHVAPKKVEEKIKKIGLAPRSASKMAHHPERVYLAHDKHDAQTSLYNDLKFSTKKQPEKYLDEYKDWIIIALKTTNIRRLFKDPNYEYGFYTFSNIPPSDIISIEEIK